MNPRPLITLTTDFGTADGYVGAMKGRILSLAPEAILVDVSHEIAPQNVLQGAWCLKRAVPRFPPGTVHLAVVDPGVGSARRGLVMETERFLLVGPDNGLLSLAAQEDSLRRVFAIAEQGPGWHKSETFDGLELFAPVAALVAAGLTLEAAGTPIRSWRTLEEEEPRQTGTRIEGRVLFCDRFGNAITNVTREHLAGRTPLRIAYGEDRPARFCGHYAALAQEAASGAGGTAGSGEVTVGALWNSDGHLELAIYRGSARERCGLAEGTPVLVLLGDP